jgi:hypothetical protein
MVPVCSVDVVNVCGNFNCQKITEHKAKKAPTMAMNQLNRNSERKSFIKTRVIDDRIRKKTGRKIIMVAGILSRNLVYNANFI